ncbi:MAG: ABC transporter substrate-binding protein [Bacteriovoracia bacterium]
MKSFLLALIILVVGCTKNSKRADHIDISLPGHISTMDPANCYDTVCYVPFAQVYESLYEIEYLKRPYTLRPLLAEGFPSISTNRLKYTFKIKKGIKYHKADFLPANREVKAQDFVTQIKRLAFKGSVSQGFWLVDGKIKGISEWREKVGTDLNLFFKESIPGVTAPDDHTLVIELVRPYPQLQWAMSMSFTSPVPAEAIKATNNDLRQTFVGTGPYIIKKYNPSQEVVLEKNPDYKTSVYPSQGDRYAHENGLLQDAGAKLPFVTNVRMVVIEETQTEWLNFMSKKIDMVNLMKDQYPLALTEEGKLKPEILEENIKLQASPTLIYWWIAFNMKDSLIGKNLNLRKAIAHGVNIEKYIQLFTYNIAQKANSIFPPGISGYSPSRDLPYKYDLNKAKEFLKKAGFPDGKGLPKLVYDVRGTDTRKRQMGEFVQQELRNLGIEIEVRTNTFPAFLEKARSGELQFWQGGWVLDYPDSENVLQLLTSTNMPPGPNSSQYSNPEFDKMFNELRELEDGDRKFTLMKKMEDLVNRDLPWSMQYYSRNYILYHDYLKNFRYSDIIYNNIKYLKVQGK